jgi:hypothetical protein
VLQPHSAQALKDDVAFPGGSESMHSGGAVAAHTEAAAERIVCWLGRRTGMPEAVADLALLK